MRILEQQVIIETAFLITVLLSLFIVNLYFLLRLKLSRLTLLIHISSFFALIFLLCLLMDVIVLDLPVEYLYRSAARISLTLCLVTLLLPIVSFLFTGRSSNMKFRRMPNLKSVFTSMEDLALIVDYEGFISEVNHPERLLSLLGREFNTMSTFMTRLREIASDNSFEELESTFLEAREMLQLEIHFPEQNQHYLLSLTPLDLNGAYCGATIVLHDITELKASEQQLKLHNEYLKEANQKLSSYVRIANVLEAEKERLTLLQQVQTVMSCRMEEVIAYVRNIRESTLDNNIYKNEVSKVADMLRDVYKEVRLSVQSISGKERGNNNDQSIDS